MTQNRSRPEDSDSESQVTGFWILIAVTVTHAYCASKNVTNPFVLPAQLSGAAAARGCLAAGIVSSRLSAWLHQESLRVVYSLTSFGVI